MSLQRNVQQQNEMAFKAMLKTATHFRKHGVPVGFQAFLTQHGIELSTSALVRVKNDSYMLGFEYGLEGLIVTQNHRFFEFELELDSSFNRIVFVHKYSEVTEHQDTSEHNQGTGKGARALAIEVVEVLNEI